MIGLGFLIVCKLKPTKEQCLEAIKLYYDTKDLPDAKSHKVTKKKKSVVEANVETNQNQNQNETIRRRTRRNQVTENVSTVASRSASIDEAAKNQDPKQTISSLTTAVF